MYGGKAVVGNMELSECIFQPRDVSCPARIMQVSYRLEQNKIRLLVGNLVVKEVESDIFKKTFGVFEKDFGDTYIELDTQTGEITFNNIDPDFIIQEKIMNSTSLSHAFDFIMEAIKVNNLFVYSVFTEIIPSKVDYRGDYITCGNIMKHLGHINVFEKIIKVSGYNFLFTNLCNPDFQVSSAKKLKKAMGIPEEVREYISHNGYECLFSTFQKISDNVNDIKDFIEYLKLLKKLTKLSKQKIVEIVNLIGDIYEMLEDVTLRQVMNYLVRETFFFTRLNDETSIKSVLIEWKDAIIMGMAAGIKFDNFPQNMKKYHRILAKNVDILNNPRPEEFAEAVSLYSRLAKDMVDEGYIIRPPKDEKELVDEGNILHHCVASYRDRIIDNHTIVLFCRKIDEPDVPLYTIELDYTPGDTSFVVAQFKKMFDADVTEPELLKMLNNYRENRRYLIDGGKNLFRKPRVFKPKKGDGTENVTAESEEND